MMRWPQGAALYLGIPMLLSGCMGSEPPSIQFSGSIDEVPEVYGTVQGSVVDDELLPVPEVRVALMTTPFWTITNREGAFRFDYVPPGVYKAEARLRDFEPVTQQVTVEDQEIAYVTIQVTYPPVTRPHEELFIFNGFIGCQTMKTNCPAYSSPNERGSFKVPIGDNLTAVLAEVTWQPNLVPAKFNYMRMTAHWVGEGIQDRNWVRGPPPYLRNHIPEGSLIHGKLPTPLQYQVNLFTEFVQINYYDLSVAYEQRFILYVTSFYLEDRVTKDYTAVPS